MKKETSKEQETNDLFDDNYSNSQQLVSKQYRDYDVKELREAIQIALDNEMYDRAIEILSKYTEKYLKEKKIFPKY
jgi:hypothetical protein